MKINIEVDFNFPPDYGNPGVWSMVCVCMCMCVRMCVVIAYATIHSLLRFALDVLSLKIFVFVIIAFRMC